MNNTNKEFLQEKEFYRYRLKKKNSLKIILIINTSIAFKLFNSVFRINI